ncbi:MAG: SPOR domain-containing protein [Novosphingobium sp.]|nr:SPOR domain-containing protein [Novosphingobium sp.]
MNGDENDGRRPIFTGDDLPPEAPIAPSETPVPPRSDEETAFEPAPASARLGLDDDERLPWLESADDIDADEGVDGGRIVGFVLLGVVALAMIVGAVWFVTNRGGPGPADGSLIRAESGPYKVAPEDPGGKTFAGTGDTSYAVAQGEARPGTVAGSASPAPSPTPTARATASAAPQPAGGGVGVQVGAYTSAADAEAGWSALASRHDALSGLKHRVVEGQADFGRVFRLQAVAADLAAANALCASLKAAGQGCQVKR